MLTLTKVKQIRDISFLLALARQQQAHGEEGEYSPELNAMMVAKLEDLDGRTGHREKGKGAALNPVSSVATAASGGKKGARRR